jgi:hypothetical protein
MQLLPNKSAIASCEQHFMKTGRRQGIKYHTLLICVLAIGLLLRLGLAYFSPGAAYDMNSYRMQGQAVLDGQNIYTATAGRHPYPPVWMFVPAVALTLEKLTGWPFTFWVRLPAIGFDVGIGILLWVLSRQKKDPLTALQDTTLYVFNPIALLVTSHGMFDSIPLFFILLAYLSIARLQNRRRSTLSALALGLGIAIKGFPVLALPAFIFKQEKWRHRITYGLVSLAPLAVLTPFIAASGGAAVERVFARVGVPDHGHGLLLQTLANMNHPALQRALDLLRARGSVLVMGSVLLGTWFARHRPLSELILLAFGLTYVVSTGIASQHLLWILPFLILANNRRAVIYSLSSTVTLLIYYAVWEAGVIGLRTAVDVEMINPIRLVTEAIWWLVCLEVTWAVIRGKVSAPVAISRRQLPQLISLLLAMSLLAVGSLSWWRIKYPTVAQHRAEQPVGQSLPSSTVGQSFYSPADGLHQIDVVFGTYGHPGTSDVILHLRQSPAAAQDLATAKINSQDIENNVYNSFHFPEQQGIVGHTIYFYLEAPDASPGSAVSPYHSNEDVYPDGQAYYDGVAMSHDLAFVAHYRLGPLDAARFMLRQLSKERPCLLGNPAFYVVLIAVHYALIGKLLGILREHRVQTTGEEKERP